MFLRKSFTKGNRQECFFEYVYTHNKIANTKCMYINKCKLHSKATIRKKLLIYLDKALKGILIVRAL